MASVRKTGSPPHVFEVEAMLCNIGSKQSLMHRLAQRVPASKRSSVAAENPGNVMERLSGGYVTSLCVKEGLLHLCYGMRGTNRLAKVKPK
jgi:hypothetical protein